jgi:uncharacterized surface protein with fasciclin (FAS1) repeats
MFRILPKTLWILAAISTVLNCEISAYCARCVKIEEERAKEQAEHPQTVGYYDDQKSKNDRSSQRESPSEDEKKQSNHSVDFLSALNLAQNQGSSKDGKGVNGGDEQLKDSSVLPPKEEFFEEEEVITPTPSEIRAIEDLEYSKRKTHFGGESGRPISGADASYSAVLTIFKTKSFLETLDGAFTLFVPTNEAFSKLPPDTLIELAKPENREKLATLVSNHAVAKKLLRKDFEKYENQEIKAISGRNLTVRSENGKLTVEGAQVLRIEPGGYDGIIYVIDKVLYP